MIKTFKHKGLEKFFLTGNKAFIQAKHANKLKMQLAAIDTAFVINDLNLPNYRLHSLKGNKSGLWLITVNGNWRITFEFLDGNAYI